MKPFEKISDIPLHAKLYVHEIPGELVWKCGLEHPSGTFHGEPYYQIYVDFRRKDPMHYLFQFDPETKKYELIDASESMNAMTEKGFRLEDETARRLYPERYSEETQELMRLANRTRIR